MNIGAFQVLLWEELTHVSFLYWISALNERQSHHLLMDNAAVSVGHRRRPEVSWNRSNISAACWRVARFCTDTSRFRRPTAGRLAFQVLYSRNLPALREDKKKSINAISKNGKLNKILLLDCRIYKNHLFYSLELSINFLNDPRMPM